MSTAPSLAPSESAGPASPRAAMREGAHEPFAPPPRPVRRPVFLDVTKIRQPIAATVSIAHRVSGILLVLAMPVLVGFVARSVRDERGYAQVLHALQSVPGRVVLVVLAWCLAHHTAAGIRHLLFDAGIGTRYATARRTAWAVHAIAALAVLAALAAALLGAGGGR